MAFQTALPQLVLNVPSIADKTEEEVRRLLGPPAQTTSSGSRLQRHPKLTYRAGSVEIVFVNGRSECIVLHDTRLLELHPKCLAKLGLPITKPTEKSKGRLLRWTNIRGVRDVTLFAGGRNRVSHVRINVHALPGH